MKNQSNTHGYTKETIVIYKSSLQHRFKNGEDVVLLSQDLSKFLTEILKKQWTACQLDSEQNSCLVALGGFARAELQPHSDLDILILNQATTQSIEYKVERFIQSLWDLGLTIGHQVNTLEATINLASQDLATTSSIMDMCYIAGNIRLSEALAYHIHPTQIWPSKSFFNAKWQEQINRYKKFNSTAYNLEPNIKNGPGGLRDIQMILWIAKRHFGEKDLEQCLQSGLLSEKECNTLKNCQLFLWRVRYALHFVANSSEDRLLFCYQKSVAAMLGFKHQIPEVAIEKFMKSYFQNSKLIRELNELILQYFREKIFYNKQKSIQLLDKDFRLVNNFIEITSVDAFKNKPYLLLKIFDLLYSNSNIKGILSNTMRLLKRDNYLIDSNFREKQFTKNIFLKLLKNKLHVYHILKGMHRFGLLNRYIPEFGNISGQMQYDLFHVYTVDQHSLFVIRNLINFQKENNTFPLCHELFKQLTKPEILFIAALYHDIGKGQNTDHSLLGEKYVDAFCKQHNLIDKDRHLICFLVKHHLIMSHTAQRKDIDDRQVIKDLCQIISDETKLNHLYLLTVADICATNPTLWNSWKDALLKNLFYKVKNQLNIDKEPDESLMITKQKQQALKLLHPLKKENILQLWQNFRDSYFLQYPPQIIVEQTKAILSCSIYPVVLVHPHHSDSGTQVFIYAPVCKSRFTISTTIISNLNLSIVEARVFASKNGYSVDNYIILNENQQKQIANKTLEALKQTLINHLTPPISIPHQIKRKIARRQKQINLKPKITFITNTKKKRTEMLLVTMDRSALLAQISYIFTKYDIEIQNAKISTSGEHVEDTFYISFNNHPLNCQLQNLLKEEITSELTIP